MEETETMNCNNEVSTLPEPKIVLFPSEQVQLGWPYNKMAIGCGLDNSGYVCYVNATLQVCVSNNFSTLNLPNALNLFLFFYDFRLCFMSLRLPIGLWMMKDIDRCVNKKVSNSRIFNCFQNCKMEITTVWILFGRYFIFFKILNAFGVVENTVRFKYVIILTVCLLY